MFVAAAFTFHAIINLFSHKVVSKANNFDGTIVVMVVLFYMGLGEYSII